MSDSRPPLYSRVGFAHHYTALTGDELHFVLTRRWRKSGVDLDIDDFYPGQLERVGQYLMALRCIVTYVPQPAM